MVLWWSAAPKPDLGGSEEDANSTEEPIPPQISVKGCYSSVVLEMDVKQLALDAVLQSALVNEMEGSGAGSMAFDTASHNLDEYVKGTANTSVMLGDAVLSTQTFGVLKAMLRTWFLDDVRLTAKGDSGNPAGLLLDHFWRWVRSSSSNMFEPALHRFLHGLMRKTFLQLLAELKRLGTTIVYADYQRIFLLTSKPDAGSAVAFGKYLITAANSQELFRHLKIGITHYWNYLAWMDVANFGGFRVTPEEASRRDGHRVKIPVSMDFNIVSFLPAPLQPVFEHNVGNFIYHLYKAKLGSDNGRTPLRPIYNLNIDTPGDIAASVSDPTKDQERAEAEKSITSTLTRKVLEDVSAVKKTQSAALLDADLAESFYFPDLPGARPDRHNPTLELVKAITEVFSLAKDYSVEVGILKRNLLDLLGVREFSPEAAWRNPCESIVVPMVICQRCSAIRDVDLCRDPDRLPRVDSETLELLPPPRKSWCCIVSHSLPDLYSRVYR